MCGRRDSSSKLPTFATLSCGLVVNTSISGSGGVGFKPRPSSCFLGQGILLHFVSLHLGLYLGMSDVLLGGNPATDQHTVQGRVAIFLDMLHAKETGTSSGCLAHVCLYLTPTLLLSLAMCKTLNKFFLMVKRNYIVNFGDIMRNNVVLLLIVVLRNK